jgi:hypothetical protein
VTDVDLKTKTFDCVEMKREGARRIYEELKDVSTEEQVDFWRRGTEELRTWITHEREKKAGASSSP